MTDEKTLQTITNELTTAYRAEAAGNLGRYKVRPPRRRLGDPGTP